MDWSNLFSALLGGLLAVIPVLITIRNQAKERNKDRQEQRMEAKTQLALELTRNDIMILEEKIDGFLKSMGELRRMKFKHPDSGDQVQEEFQLKIAEEDSFFRQVHVDLVAEKLAYTLGEEFYSEYTLYKRTVNDCMSIFLSVPFQYEKEKQLRPELISSAGKLHTMLRDKLISIRDN